MTDQEFVFMALKWILMIPVIVVIGYVGTIIATILLGIVFIIICIPIGILMWSLAGIIWIKNKITKE